jgi:para-nitrobenzyl esterase
VPNHDNGSSRGIIRRRTFLGWSLLVGASIRARGSFAGGAIASAQATPIVDTNRGKLIGATEDGVMSFKGVPYGGPTGGEARFMPPQPVPSWTGVRSALNLGAPIYQEFEGPNAWLDPGMIRDESEDCLVLNVWAPAADIQKKKPVMVWLHGGGFAVGSGGVRIYDGHNLARHGDVVVVTANHRLNVFGYTYLGGLSEQFATGNVGQLDLVAALEWVRENIAGFGGDPGCVTIFGQSGGGTKVLTLMAMPAAKGLFHRAIVQSGPHAGGRNREEGTTIAKALLAELHIPANRVARLQEIPAADLLRAYSSLIAQPGRDSFLSFSPIVDGVSLPTDFSDPAAVALSAHVPVMIGNTRDETVQFINADRMPSWGMSPGENLLLQLGNDEELRAFIIQQSPIMASRPPSDTDKLIAAYRLGEPNASRLQTLIHITSDVWIWRDTVMQTNRRAAHSNAPVFAYEFRWKAPCFGSQWAPHGGELPFVFNNLDYEMLFDEHDIPETRSHADPQNLRAMLRDRMVAAWTAFARTGTPSTSILPWTPYTRDREAVMIFDTRSSVIENPWAPYRRLVLDMLRMPGKV